MKLRTLRSEITDYLWACPYCGSSMKRMCLDKKYPNFHGNCCVKSCGHLVKAYLVRGHDDIVLEDEIIIEE